MKYEQMMEDISLLKKHVNSQNNFNIVEKNSLYRLDINDMVVNKNFNENIQQRKVFAQKLSYWYKHLFYVKSSLAFQYCNKKILNFTFGVISEHNFYENNIKNENFKYKKIDNGLFAIKTMNYKNDVNVNLIENEINNFFTDNVNYKLRHNPISKLITSYNDEVGNKINIFELLIPITEKKVQNT